MNNSDAISYIIISYGNVTEATIKRNRRNKIIVKFIFSYR